MSKVSKITDFIFTKKVGKKVLAYLFLILFIYLFSDFAFIFFMTFLFAYLFFSLSQAIKMNLDIFISNIYTKYNITIVKKFFSIDFIIIFLYILFVTVIVLLLTNILPQLAKEITEITKEIPVFREYTELFSKTLIEIDKWFFEMQKTLKDLFWTNDPKIILRVVDKLKNVWIVFFQVIMALVLSLVFLLDRKRLDKYLLGLKESNFSFFYIEYEIIFEKILKSFWLIFKAQTMIALANSILTIIWLNIIWFIFYWDFFPYVLTLWLVVFIFWFVPVLWVFISSIPMIFIAYNINDKIDVATIAVVALIFIIHMIEAYYLNPKIVASFLDFPVSLTFIILIISEHIFGFAWLLIWISLFYFIVWLRKDIDKSITEKRENKKKKWDKFLI